jgi:proteasome alpha subunit
MNHVFTTELKPLEVEILIAEVGLQSGEDQLFRITFDGVVVDEEHFSVLGGESEPIVERLGQTWAEQLSLGDAMRTARAALAGPDRTLDANELEVAVLSRSNGRRAFRRIEGDALAALLTPDS